MAVFWFKRLHYESLMDFVDEGSRSIATRDFDVSSIGLTGQVSFAFPQGDFGIIGWRYTAKTAIALGFDDHDKFVSLHYLPEKERGIIITAGNTSTIRLNGGNDLQALTILMEKKWLLQHFPLLKQVVATNDLDRNKEAVSFGMNAADIRVCTSVINYLLTEKWNNVFCKAALYLLLDNFRGHLLSLPLLIGSKAVEEAMRFVQLKLIDETGIEYPLKGIAEQPVMAGYKLKRIFKTHYGKSPYDWYLAQRLSLGAEWLITTEKPIGDISSELGYETESSFALAFRTFFHSTPSQWRKQHLGLSGDEKLSS